MINLIPKYKPTTRTRKSSISPYKCRTNCFKHSFFPSTLNDWFNLDINIKNLESISLFKCRLLHVGYIQYCRPYRIKIPNSSLLRHDFLDFPNPLRSCSLETEDTSHYLRHWHHFSNCHIDLMNNAKSVCDNFESMSDDLKKNVLLYGDSRFNEFTNIFILEATITHIKKLWTVLWISFWLINLQMV